jgi:hypothetical protein
MLCTTTKRTVTSAFGFSRKRAFTVAELHNRVPALSTSAGYWMQPSSVAFFVHHVALVRVVLREWSSFHAANGSRARAYRSDDVALGDAPGVAELRARQDRRTGELLPSCAGWLAAACALAPTMLEYVF